MNAVNQFAVIGNPIGHSISPYIHQYFAKQIGKTIFYEKIQTSMPQFEMVVRDFFAHRGCGLNITLPFKEAAFAMATIRSPRATVAKAANTLWMEKGQLCADNTDGVGLIRDLSRHVVLSQSHILILGAGGGARGIIDPLLDAGVLGVHVYNRTAERLLRLCADFPFVIPLKTLDEARQFDIIINATGIRETPWPLSIVLQHKPLPFCYDLSYSLGVDTAFVAWAKQQVLPTCDGLGMLIEQAAESFYIWHGVRLQNSMLDTILRHSHDTHDCFK